jgi:RNA polymerase sigma-70 factor (ECF subfamily)
MKTTPADRFAATRWTVVLAAGQQTSQESRRALEELCRIHWYPLYAYVRRCGYAAQAAEDLTQEFFARLLAKKSFAEVDRAKGKFRSFLVASLKLFLTNKWDKARAVCNSGHPISSPNWSGRLWNAP